MYDDRFTDGYLVGASSNNGYNNGFGFGGDGAWWIIILLIFGWGGNNGFGGNFGGGNNMLGYELGKVATTNDIASGFNNSAVLSSLNDLKLGQAGVQQTLCQGFSGVNATVNTVANQINQGICNLGYTVQGAFNDVSRQLADCCCGIKTELLQNRYLNEKQTCDIVAANTANTQRVIDFLTNEKLDTLNRKLATTEAENSQLRNNAYLISQLKEPCPIPAYLTPNPNCCYGNYGLGTCGASIQ